MHMYGMPIESVVFKFTAGAKNHFPGYPAPLVVDCEIIIPRSLCFAYALFLGEFPTPVLAGVAEGLIVKMKIARVSGSTSTSLASDFQPRRGRDIFFRT